MLPHNKYYSLFTFIFGILAKLRIPKKKHAALPYKSTPNMPTPVPATRPSFKNGERDAILKSSNAYLRT
jgi:hypothetical protein